MGENDKRRVISNAIALVVTVLALASAEGLVFFDPVVRVYDDFATLRLYVDGNQWAVKMVRCPWRSRAGLRASYPGLGSIRTSSTCATRAAGDSPRALDHYEFPHKRNTDGEPNPSCAPSSASRPSCAAPYGPASSMRGGSPRKWMPCQGKDLAEKLSTGSP